MKKFISLILSIFLVFTSCENLMTNNSSTYSFSFSEENTKDIKRGIENSPFITNDDVLDISCDLIGVFSARHMTAKSSINDIANVRFIFNEVDFGNYVIKIDISYKDEVLYSGVSEEIKLREFNPSPKVSIGIGPKAYAIKYEMDNGALCEGSVLHSSYNFLSHYTLPLLTKKDCTFNGWYTLPDGQGEKVTELGRGNFLKDVTLYAYFTSSDFVTPPTIKRVSEVTFSPNIENIDKGEKISLSCNTPSSTIYYTLDGTTPSINSNVYTTPFTINKNSSIKAYAVKEGYKDSAITQKSYILKTYTVSFSVPSGFKKFNDQIKYKGEKITLPIAEEKTGYHFDGWYDEKGNLITTNEITVTKDTIISAKYKNIINLSVSSKTTDVKTTKAKLVTLSAANSEIRYTTDGSAVTKSSNPYTSSFNVTSSCKVRAKAYPTDDTHYESNEVSADFYSISLSTTDGTLSFDTIIKESGESFTLEELPEPKGGSKLFSHYDMNGTKIESGKTYTVDSDIELNAIMLNQNELPPPSMTVANGVDKTSKNVTLSSTKPCDIYYTTDGSAVTKSSIPYSKAITVDKSLIIKAKAFAKDASFTDSTEVSKEFFTVTLSTTDGTLKFNTLIKEKGETFTLDELPLPEGGAKLFNHYDMNGVKIESGTTYPVNADVTLNAVLTEKKVLDPPLHSLRDGSPKPIRVLTFSSKEPCEIYFTTDGSEVTKMSHSSGNGVTISSSQRVRAKAFATSAAYLDSPESVIDFYTVTIETTDGTLSFNKIIKEKGENLTLSELPLPEGGAKLFSHYEMNGVKIENGKNYPITSDVTLNAVFALSSPKMEITASPDLSYKTVKLTSTEPCDIYYTLDGSEVTKSSTCYRISITVDNTMKIRAKAFAKDATFTDSIETSKEFFAINLSTTDGSINPPRLIKEKGETFTLSELPLPSGGSMLFSHYDMGGTKIESGTTYPVNSEITLNAVSTAKTELKPPLITALVGSDISNKTVKLSSTEPCEIRYTTDGSTVTSSSTLYENALTITSSQKIQAKAFPTSSSYIESKVASKQFFTVTIETTDGTLAHSKMIKEEDETFTLSDLPLPEGSTKTFSHYFTDGGKIVSGTQYPVRGDMKLTAVFALSDCVVTVKNGSDLSTKSVTVTNTDACDIYYTLDGSEPSNSKTKTKYTTSITIDKECELKVIALPKDSSSASSSVTSKSFVALSLTTNYGTVPFNKAIYEKGSTVVVGDLPQLTLSDKQFKGWKNSNTPKLEGQFVVNSSDTLVAIWGMNDVTFSIDPLTTGIKYDSALELSCDSALDPPSSCEIYYTLDGTVPTKQNGTKYTTAIKLGELPLTASKKIKVQAVAFSSDNSVLSSTAISKEYSVQTVTLHYDANNTSMSGITLNGTMKDEVCVLGEKKTLTQNAFSMEGFKFNSWHLVSELTDSAIFDKAIFDTATYNDNDVINFYAAWDEVSAILSVEIPIVERNHQSNGKLITCTIRGNKLTSRAKDVTVSCSTATISNPTVTDVDDKTLSLSFSSDLNGGTYPIQVTMDGKTITANLVIREILHGLQAGDVLLEDGTYAPCRNTTGLKVMGVVIDPNFTTDYGIPYLLKLKDESKSAKWANDGTPPYNDNLTPILGSGSGLGLEKKLIEGGYSLTDLPCFMYNNSTQFLPSLKDSQNIISNLTAINASLSAVGGDVLIEDQDTSYWLAGVRGTPGRAYSLAIKGSNGTQKEVLKSSLLRVRLITW